MDRKPLYPTARLWVSLATLVLLAGGCSGSSPFVARRSTVGSLRGDLARLETESQALRRDNDELKAENKRVASRLVDAEEVNSDLAARLDDARTELGKLGGGPTLASGSPPDPEPARSRTTPARNKNRRAPFAQIPGQFRPAEPRKDRRDAILDEDPLPPADDPDAQTSTDPIAPWMDVPRGLAASPRKVR